MGGPNRATIDKFLAALQAGDNMALGRMVDEVATDDIVEEWPQSGERIRGKDAIKRLFASYEGATGKSPKFDFRRILGGGDVYVVEGTIDYGDGIPVNYIGISEFHDGLLTKITEYFANPFEAPEWRKDMVERIEPAAV